MSHNPKGKIMIAKILAILGLARRVEVTNPAPVDKPKEVYVPTPAERALRYLQSTEHRDPSRKGCVDILLQTPDTMAHLNVGLTCVFHGDHYSQELIAPAMKKWVESKGTTLGLKDFWDTSNRYYCPTGVKFAWGVWVSLTKSLGEIEGVPDFKYVDDILDSVRIAKWDELARVAFAEAKDADGIIDVWNRISKYSTLKGGSLGLYPVWAIDEKLRLSVISELYKNTPENSVAKSEATEKWMKVSRRHIDETIDARVMRSNHECVHESLMEDYLKKWNELSLTAIAKATSVEEAVSVIRYAPKKSEAHKAGLIKWNELSLIDVAKATTVEEITQATCNAPDDSDAKVAGFTKWTQLASTESEIRGLWGRLPENSVFRQELTKKLGLLHK